jgi:hypothetical protein
VPGDCPNRPPPIGLLALLAARSGSSAPVGAVTAAAVVGPEFPLDAPVPSPEAGDQSQPQLACAGDTCLAVGQRALRRALAAGRPRRSRNRAVTDTTPLMLTTAYGGGDGTARRCRAPAPPPGGVWPDRAAAP